MFQHIIDASTGSGAWYYSQGRWARAITLPAGSASTGVTPTASRPGRWAQCTARTTSTAVTPCTAGTRGRDPQFLDPGMATASDQDQAEGSDVDHQGLLGNVPGPEQHPRQRRRHHHRGRDHGRTSRDRDVRSGMMHRGGYVGGHSERFERLGGKDEGPAAYRAEPAHVIGPACRSATMPTHWRGPTFCGSTSAVTPRGATRHGPTTQRTWPYDPRRVQPPVVTLRHDISCRLRAAPLAGPGGQCGVRRRLARPVRRVRREPASRLRCPAAVAGRHVRQPRSYAACLHHDRACSWPDERDAGARVPGQHVGGDCSDEVPDDRRVLASGMPGHPERLPAAAA